MWIIKLDNHFDHYGNKKKDCIVGVFDSNEAVQNIISKIEKNPYFTGNAKSDRTFNILSVVEFDTNKDYTGYSDYKPS